MNRTRCFMALTVLVCLPGFLLPAKAQGSPEVYAERAMAEVRKNLDSQGMNSEEFRFKLVGNPVVKPDCSGLHPEGSSRSRHPEATAGLPDAFVHINVYRGSVFKERATVIFMNQKPLIRFSGRESPGSAFSEAAMDEEELQQVGERLDPFFATAVDVSRGSERFHSFLPLDIRSLLKHPDPRFRLYMPPAAVEPSWREMLLKETGSRKAGPFDGVDNWKKKLSDKDLRSFVAMTLDLAVQQNWTAFEGLPQEPEARLEPQLLVSNPKEYIKLLQKTVSQNRRLLEKAGVLAPSHLRLTSDYLKQLIGRSLIVKEVSGPEPCPCFLLPYLGDNYISSPEAELEAMDKVPEDAALYLFGMEGLRLHFSNLDAFPRIACIAID